MDGEQPPRDRARRFGPSSGRPGPSDRAGDPAPSSPEMRLRRRDLDDLAAGHGDPSETDRPRRPTDPDRPRRPADPDRPRRPADPDRPRRPAGDPRDRDRPRPTERDRDRLRRPPPPPPGRTDRLDRPERPSSGLEWGARLTGWWRRAGPPGRPPADRTHDGGDPHRRSARRGLRVAVAVLSALVFALSGTAWAALSGSVGTSSNALGGPVGDAADGATDILLVGVDSRTDAQGRPLPQDVLAAIGASQAEGVVNTDTMILVRIPNDGSRAVAFSIPRDSYIAIPGELRRDKINSTYPAAKAAETQRLVASGVTDPREVDVRSSEAGRQELVKAVASLTGLTVDHFAEVNLLGFYNLTQAIGGVEVCLKNPTRDEKSGAFFRAGPQTVSGHDALAFVRQRYGLAQGDLGRIRRQQAFLAGLSNKILSAGTLADPFTLSRLLDAVQQSVVLDGGWDVLRFAQQMQGVSAGSVAFLTIPTEGTEQVDERGEVVRVDPATVRRFVSDAIGEGADSASTDADEPAPGTIPVDVRNASGTDGAAARVVAVLGAQGYTRTASGNADAPTPASVVLFGPGADAAGARVARTLGDLPTHVDSRVPPGTVRVLLGAEYDGPGATPTTSRASGTSGSTGSTGGTAGAGTGASAAGSSAGATTPAPPPAPAITADGVPCVD